MICPQKLPHLIYTKPFASRIYLCDDDDDDDMFGGHPKGEQVRGRCPTELVTAPNVLVTTPVPPPHLQPPVM